MTIEFILSFTWEEEKVCEYEEVRAVVRKRRSDGTYMSSSVRGLSSVLNVYWKPEQPPPSTANRRYKSRLLARSCRYRTLCKQPHHPRHKQALQAKTREHCACPFLSVSPTTSTLEFPHLSAARRHDQGVVEVDGESSHPLQAPRSVRCGSPVPSR